MLNLLKKIWQLLKGAWDSETSSVRWIHESVAQKYPKTVEAAIAVMYNTGGISGDFLQSEGLYMVQKHLCTKSCEVLDEVETYLSNLSGEAFDVVCYGSAKEREALVPPIPPALEEMLDFFFEL